MHRKRAHVAVMNSSAEVNRSQLMSLALRSSVLTWLETAVIPQANAQ